MQKLLDDALKSVTPYAVELATAAVTALLAWLRAWLQRRLASHSVSVAGKMHASTKLVVEHAEDMMSKAHPLLRPVTKRGARRLVGRAIADNADFDFDNRPTNPDGRKP